MPKQSLRLTSRHAAKVATGVLGRHSTGKIHSLATCEKYVWMAAEKRANLANGTKDSGRASYQALDGS